MPRHSPYALVRLNFRKDLSLLARFSFELYEFLLNITFRDFLLLAVEKVSLFFLHYLSTLR